MTVQQEAYRLIDRLSNDSVLALIHLMKCMVPEQEKREAEKTAVQSLSSKKRNAYFRLKELRNEMKDYSFSEDDRAEALAEKFGTY